LPSPLDLTAAAPAAAKPNLLPSPLPLLLLLLLLLLLNDCLRYEGVMYYGINIDLNPT
jgi:hypothetical protein